MNNIYDRVTGSDKNINPFSKGILLSVFFFGLISLSYSQEAVTASGATITGTGGSMSYSVGQVSYVMNVSPDGSEAQGVQQPYEIFVYPGIDVALLPHRFIAVYPNPVNNQLMIRIDIDTIKDLEVVLYDITGKVLAQYFINSHLTTIDMSSYSRAVYLLRVYHGALRPVVFRIVKN